MNSDSNIYVCTSGRIYTCRLLIGAMQGSKLSKSRINLVEVQDISSNAAASNGQKKISQCLKKKKYLRKIILTKTFEIPIGELSVSHKSSGITLS